MCVYILHVAIYICACVSLYVQSVPHVSPNNSWESLLLPCDQIARLSLTEK